MPGAPFRGLFKGSENRRSHLISIDGNYQRATVGHIGLRYAL
jgi:hypothetical protein